MTQIILVDLNFSVIAALAKEFNNIPNVTCVHGSILEQKVDAWVTPTNSRGNMSGGVDAAIKGRLGSDIEQRLQASIKSNHAGFIKVGNAAVIPTFVTIPRYIIATPTMEGDSDDVSRTKNAALACAAAFQAIYTARDMSSGKSIETIAIPGLGAGTGKTPASLCARLMKAGFILFERKRFESFEEMQKELLVLLAEMDLIPYEPSPKPVTKKSLEYLKPSLTVSAPKVEKKMLSKKRYFHKSHYLTLSQCTICDVLESAGKQLSPYEIGVKCGVDERLASRWAWPRLNTLRSMGIVEKPNTGRYRFKSY